MFRTAYERERKQDEIRIKQIRFVAGLILDQIPNPANQSGIDILHENLGVDIEVHTNKNQVLTTSGSTTDLKELETHILNRPKRFRKLSEVWPHPVGYVDGKVFTIIKRDLDSIVIFWAWNLPSINFPALIFGLILLIGLLIWVIIRVGKWLKPLEEFDSFAKEISRGNYNARTGYKGEDELGILASTLNGMASKIKLSMERQQLLRDVSHELRTPITRIKLALEIQPLNGASIKEDVTEVEGMIDNLLTSFREGNQLDDIQLQSFDALPYVPRNYFDF